MKTLGAIVILVISLLGGLSPAHARLGAPLSKSQIISELKIWADQNEADKTADPLEKDLRRVFIYRLRFQVERRYEGNDASLVRVLKFMKDLENNPQNRSLSQLADFLDELIRCIEENREPAEQLYAFLKQYTRVSGITEPLMAEDYAEDRAYLNAGQTQSARELRDEDWVELGELFDDANKEAEAPKPVVTEAPSTPMNDVKPEVQTTQPEPHFVPTGEEESSDLKIPKAQDPQAPGQILNL